MWKWRLLERMLLSRDVICSDGTVQNDGFVSQSKGRLQLGLRPHRPDVKPVLLQIFFRAQDLVAAVVVVVEVDVDADHRCPITTLASGEPPRIAFGQSMFSSTTRPFPDFVSRHTNFDFSSKNSKK